METNYAISWQSALIITRSHTYLSGRIKDDTKMTLSELLQILEGSTEISFQLPDGRLVPRHFHVTEVAKLRKEFIDCGGKMRTEDKISLQLWEEQDYDHRLHPDKLVHILKLSQDRLGLEDKQIVVEYQGESISTYDLDYEEGKGFLLLTKQTACLARESCAIPIAQSKSNFCAPESSCC